jgi:hypothetical protein
VEVARLHSLTLENIKYYAKHKLGIGSVPNCHSAESPFLGSGQGAADSPARWGFISDALIRCYKKISHPAILRSPISARQINQQIQAFVDDTRTLLLNQQSNFSTGIYSHLMEMVQQDVQAWEQFLHSASGKLELPKCRFGLIRWQYDSTGTASLYSSDSTTLTITDSENHSTVQVPQLDTSEAYKYLGVQIAFDGNMVSQRKSLRDKCQQFQSIFAQCNLSHSNMQLCYRTVFSPAVRYVLPATSLDWDFLEDVQKPIISLVLSKMGFNSHMPREVALAPLHFGGLGLMDLVVAQGIAQVLFVLGHIRSQSSTASTIYILLESFQVSAGIDHNPLEDTLPCPYIDSPWVHSIQSFLRKCNASIQLPALTTKSPLRIHDRTIMSFIDENYWSPSDVRKINNCRMFLQVLYVSEIVNSAGTHLLDQALYGTVDRHGKSLLTQISSSAIEWPAQVRPDNQTWGVWKKFLSTSITINVSRTQLRQHLGDWVHCESPVRRWHYLYNPTSNTISHRCNNTTVHFGISSNRTRNQHQFQVITTPGLLLGTIPTTPTSVSSTAITIGTPPIHIVRPYEQLLEVEAPIQYDYLQPHAQQLLQEAAQITLASDGGLLYEQISFGSVIVADDTPVITLAGKAPSHNWPSSLTAEAYGSYYAAKTVQELFPSGTSLPPITFLADNKSLLSGLQHRSSKPLHPTQCVQPEHELLFSTVQNVSGSRQLQFRHVKGHQDPNSSSDAYLNNECDRLATTARELPTPEGPARLSHRTATLLLNGLEVSSKIADHLKYAYSSQALRDYYLVKFPSWTPSVVNDVDWFIKGKALGLLPSRTQKTILQLTHNWLPVNGHPGTGKVGTATYCPYCEAVSEDMAHFLSCCHPVATQSRSAMVNSVRIHLSRAHTHPTLQQLVMSAITATEIPMPDDPTFQQLWTHQTAIGWDNILRGKLSLEWVQTVDRVTSSNSGEQWCISLLRQIWSAFYTMWKQRCEFIHGTDKERQRQLLLRDLTPRIEHLLQAKEQLLHIDQTYFCHSLETILQFPTRRLENWILKAERHFKAALLRSKRERNKQQSATLQSFFRCFRHLFRLQRHFQKLNEGLVERLLLTEKMRPLLPLLYASSSSKKHHQ